MNLGKASLCSVCLLILLAITFPTRAPAQGASNNLQARVAALEARVEKLESGQVSEEHIFGSYSIHALGIALQAGPPALIGAETSRGIATFNDDGTVTFEDTGDASWNLREGMPWTLTLNPFTPASGVLTWSVVNGKVVIDRTGDDDVVLTIGASAHVLSGGETSESEGFSNIFMMIRLPD